MRKKYANSLSTFGILIFESKISVQKTGKNYVQTREKAREKERERKKERERERNFV